MVKGRRSDGINGCPAPEALKNFETGPMPRALNKEKSRRQVAPRAQWVIRERANPAVRVDRN